VIAPVRVKICGITNPGDARIALEAGADALGFNLYPGSKRFVRMEEILPWLASLGGDAVKVAVMVNPTEAEIAGARAHFDVIQLHGQETPAQCAAAAAGGHIWKAFPLTAELDADAVTACRAVALVIDSSVPGAFGGTGKLIDLAEAARFVQACHGLPVWLSGGLSPANVREAIEKVKPYGVDVASGVEAVGNPRRKDAARVRAFVAAARNAVA
jgi:phosphoribosylanthranilate isomerase